MFHDSHFPPVSSQISKAEKSQCNIFVSFYFLFIPSQQQPPLNFVQKAREERKSEQTKMPDILNNLHAFFAFPVPEKSKAKR
jgi:hypothetical protein